MTGTTIPPGGGPDGRVVQASSSHSSSSQRNSLYPSPHPHSSSLKPSTGTTAQTLDSTTSSTVAQQQQQQQQQTPCRKRSFPFEGSASQQQQHVESVNSKQSEPAAANKSSMQCPRLQPQQLCLPRKRTQSIGTCMQGPNGTTVQCELDPSAVKANFVESLVDTAAIVIESIWPPLPGSPESPHKQKGLPLRTFIQETLKRSRSSYSTLQTALFYLHKIRNKVPSAYLKRRQDQLYQNYHILSATQPAAGLMTPPASPRHHQNASDLSNLQGPDYFSLRATPDSKCVLPSPLSSTCSLPSSSPASSTGYSPWTSTSPSSTTSSPTSSSSPSCSVSTTCATSSPTSTQSSSSTQSNRIIYCGRRTFLAALMVASKYLQDRNYSNKAWAKISGLSIKEINANELIFLKLIDYSLFVSHDTFMRWTAILVARGQEATRKFMQSADAAHVGTFSAALSTPPLVLNGSHIRYAPMKSLPNIPVSPPSETDEESTVAGSVPKRHVKVARSSTYPPLQGSYLHTSGEAFAF